MAHVVKLWIYQVFVFSSLILTFHLSHSQTDKREYLKPCLDNCICIIEEDQYTVSCSKKNLSSIPQGYRSQIEVLSLTRNNFTILPDYSFLGFTKLKTLILNENRIEFLEEDSLAGLVNLTRIDLAKNKLHHIPSVLQKLPELTHIDLSSNKIETIPDYFFHKNLKLQMLTFSSNPITTIGSYAFSSLSDLEQLVMFDIRYLTVLPDLSNNSKIKSLNFNRCRLTSIPKDICVAHSSLTDLDFHSNKITEIPKLSECQNLTGINFNQNKITSLDGEIFEGLHNLLDLTLEENLIQEIPKNVFKDLTKLQVLNLMKNQIHYIHPEAFKHNLCLSTLLLSSNLFSHLPTEGLKNIRMLHIKFNKYLLDFPAPSNFPKIEELHLSYAYHCCEFSKLSTNINPEGISETVHWGKVIEECDASNCSGIQILKGNTTGNDYDNITVEYINPDQDKHEKISVNCTPVPDPFQPCHDLFGWWSLRCGVWIVFLLAVLGNGVVICVITISRTKLDVPRFLICNLASADFFLGIYLGFLAVVDTVTLGEFKKYALPWQNSAYCQVAGFLGVFSSELSLFTLSIITLERNYAITHALHVTKRLSLKHATCVMALGWIFTAIIATLPMFGISDYKKFAICIPFETGDYISLAYVVCVMLLNGSVFLILMGCYMKMYCAIRGSQAWNSNDSRVAKRMALLVFTDFACWTPIVFFSLTAAFGKPLISLDATKILTIFVLPLNCCANPFLYGIFTKQFKRDCVSICKRIEESHLGKSFTRLNPRAGSGGSLALSHRDWAGNTLLTAENRASQNNSINTATLTSSLGNGSIRSVINPKMISLDQTSKIYNYRNSQDDCEFCDMDASLTESTHIHRFSVNFDNSSVTQCDSPIEKTKSEDGATFEIDSPYFCTPSDSRTQAIHEKTSTGLCTNSASSSESSNLPLLGNILHKSKKNKNSSMQFELGKIWMPQNQSNVLINLDKSSGENMKVNHSQQQKYVTPSRHSISYYDNVTCQRSIEVTEDFSLNDLVIEPHPKKSTIIHRSCDLSSDILLRTCDSNSGKLKLHQIYYNGEHNSLTPEQTFLNSKESNILNTGKKAVSMTILSSTTPKTSPKCKSHSKNSKSSHQSLPSLLATSNSELNYKSEKNKSKYHKSDYELEQDDNVMNNDEQTTSQSSLELDTLDEDENTYGLTENKTFVENSRKSSSTNVNYIYTPKSGEQIPLIGDPTNATFL